MLNITYILLGIIYFVYTFYWTTKDPINFMIKIGMGISAIVAVIAFANNYTYSEIITQASLLKWMWVNAIFLGIWTLVWLNSKKTPIHLAMAAMSFIGCAVSIISIIMLNA